MKRFGLRQRFILVTFSLFVVLFGIVATTQVSRTVRNERATLNEQSKSFATLATKPISDAFLMYKDSGTLRINQQIDHFLALDPDVKAVSIVDNNGRVVFKAGKNINISKQEASSFDLVYKTRHGVVTHIISPVIEDNGVHQYAIVYGISDERLVTNTQHTVVLILALSLAGFLVALLVTYWLINSFFLRPVRLISAKALDISTGHFDQHIDLKRKDEIGDLAQAVNAMANSLEADIVKLQEADKLKSEFITISSHNLRTPLTVIKGDLEMMRDMGVPDQLQSMISDVSASTAHLNTFIEDLLAISSMESGKLATYDRKPGSIKDSLEAISADYTQVARTKNLAFNLELNLADQQVVMSPHMLRIAIVNLLENAFKFTKEGSVGLNASIQNNQVVIKIADTGIGIAKDEIPKLFTKFHRGTDVMRYDYEGTGIGLYLTKLIINDHQGTVEVESTEGKGTTFTVKLPLAA
jgi:signal transduction histidine kinase